MADEQQTARRHPHVINLDELDPYETRKGKRYGANVKQLGTTTGAKAVGCNWFEVPPGRAAFPRHYHCAIEEAVFVLSGKGSLRLGDATMELRSGDYATFPAGPDHPHQIENTGDEPLRYLCLSNKAVADVVGYPDSNKIGAMASPSFNFMDPPWIRGIYVRGSEVGYYDGEDTGESE